MKVSVAEARNGLPRLIRAVERGETVTICRRGVPTVDLVPARGAAPRARRLGALRGQIEILDPNWWKPMKGAELEAFVSGDTPKAGRGKPGTHAPLRARARGSRA